MLPSAVRQSVEQEAASDVIAHSHIAHRSHPSRRQRLRRVPPKREDRHAPPLGAVDRHRSRRGRLLRRSANADARLPGRTRLPTQRLAHRRRRTCNGSSVRPYSGERRSPLRGIPVRRGNRLPSLGTRTASALRSLRNRRRRQHARNQDHTGKWLARRRRTHRRLKTPTQPRDPARNRVRSRRWSNHRRPLRGRRR